MVNRDIIVIGASAGGVRSIERILLGLPKNLPAAIFTVLHRLGGPWEMPVELLSWKMELPVQSASDLLPFRPGNVYVCPGGHHITLENGLVRVERSPKENRFRPSVDALFRSAAWTYGRRVIGVVLTGTLDDGTAGLWQIKKRGGITIVQDPSEAEFPDMPQSAMNNVSIDHVLPLDGIARKLIELTQENLANGSSEPRKTKVLIAEDEQIVAESLEERLQELGYEVTARVGTGESAIEETAQTDPDVVLMDIRLAGELTGIQAARDIWERFQIPVVYVTAYADIETLEAVKTTETYGYIVKPFHSRAIHAAIQVALSRREKEMRTL